MKLQIKTTKLQEMLTKALKGAGNNKLIPLTSLVELKVANGEFTMTTTDATNYLYITEKVESDDFYVVIQIDTFAKLVSKMTCDEISLEVMDNGLVVTGNGTYTIDIVLDEDGKVVKFPNPLADFKMDTESTISKISLATVKTILSAVKPSIDTTGKTPCLSAYYVGNSVMATDRYKVANLNAKVFDNPKLISAEMMNLLDVMTEETISITTMGNKLVFVTPNCTIYGTVANGIEDYPIDALSKFINDVEFTNNCKLGKSQLIQVLDRISLFVGAFDDNIITMNFTKTEVQISSMASTGVECIKYTESDTSEDFTEFSCLVNISTIESQIKAQTGDVVTLYFGCDKPLLKLVDGDIILIVALVSE